MKEQEKIKFMSVTEIVDHQTGEVTQSIKETEFINSKEPNYIKLYVDTLLTFKNLSKSLNPILLEFLKYMSYASIADGTGGQIIYVNAHMKKLIANATGLKIDRINKALTEFVKANVFKRIATGTYQVNPYLFGKGEWKDIKSIRATFDFNSGEIIAEIENNEIACTLEKDVM
ncbi:replication/maintenance protein RepL [Fusobacterium gastrosuis]|uniref:replication/maintenance protein RepL n=1 Tax=Fusobacterium gastrosuis TaxID=1755100 RepID=UPI002A84E94A|nr:replication/maintenance protein RepL [Lactobacillus johnsonii]MDY5305643.1 replication/maintenance protein RepL [Fusobacterium gastrosuis]